MSTKAISVLIVHLGKSGAGPAITSILADGLARDGRFEVFAALSRDADMKPSVAALPKSIQPFTYYSSLGLILSWPRLILWSIKARSFIRANKIDVVYSPMLSLWQSLALGLWMPADIKYVTTIHDAQEHPGDTHPLLVLARIQEIRRAQVVVCFSSFVANALRTPTRKRQRSVVELSHGAVALRQSGRSLPLASAEKVVGFFGRLTKYKGIDLFVQTIDYMSGRGIAVRGSVAGNGTVDPALIERSMAYIDWDIRWMPDAAVADFFDSIDLLILPYTEASQSGVLPLAASHGVPVIVTPVGALPEQAVAFGNAVVSGEVTAMSVAVAAESVLTDERFYAELSASGLKAVTGPMSWDATVADLAAVLMTQVSGA